MLRLFLACLAGLLLLLPGQSAGSPTAEAVVSGEGNGYAHPPQTGTQSAELDEARKLNQKVVQLFNEGKVDEALPLAKRVLEIREKALGREHQLVIEALLNLAELNLSKSYYRQSLSLYERVLKSSEKLSGPSDPSIIVLLDKMAYLRYMIGDFTGSENYYKRSLAINEKIFSPDSEQVAQAVYNLAEFYRFTNSYQKAEPFYQRALAILDKTLPPNDPKLIRTIDRYRCIFYQSDRMDKLKAFDAKRRARFKANNPDEPIDIINGKALPAQAFVPPVTIADLPLSFIVPP